jgi:hypothetical protein
VTEYISHLDVERGVEGEQFFIYIYIFIGNQIFTIFEPMCWLVYNEK